jgi:glycerate 2-kinase
VLGARISGGLVLVKEGHAGDASLTRIELAEAGHPVPDSRGVEATARLLSLIDSAAGKSTVLCLISGGGSALLISPAEGLTLEDLQAATGLLLRAGANINELNAVRKHLSNVSGGQLARRAAPSQVLSLVLSDVIGSPLDVIASGPTAPDPTTFPDALAVIDRYNLTSLMPAAVIERLRSGAQGVAPETPKPGDPVFERVTNLVVASNVTAAEAAARKASELGLNPLILSTYVEGEAREVGRVLASIAREIIAHNRPVPAPACVLLGGETTVTVRGDGVGGRNTELALSAAVALDGLGPDAVVFSFATDGGDGLSPSAGAIADGTTIERGRGLGLDPARFLADNDSYSYWSRLGDAIMTGPTGTNVNDLMGVLIF